MISIEMTGESNTKATEEIACDVRELREKIHRERP